MKSGITWFYRIALLCCITLFGGYTFCSRMIQHSMVHVVLNQIHIEKKLAERLNSINFPKAEEESEKLTKILEDIVNDEEVLAVLNVYTEAFVADIVKDTQSETTMKINETLKQQANQHASELSLFTEGLLSEKEVSAIMTTVIDAMDVQALYDVSLHIMKEELSDVQLTAFKILYFLKGDICYYISHLGMLLCSLLLVMQKKGLRGLTMVWLIGCLLMFVVSQTIPQLLAHVFANTKVAAALQDNIAQLERYTLILGAITLLLACLMMITAFFRKKILHKKDIA